MLHTDLISVIIPAYNVEKYIEKCLNSIIYQTYQNLEIIIVDDGSTDRTPEIIRQATADDKRCVYIRQDNAGLSAARNTGLRYAHGEYVTFVDSDDYCELGMIDRMHDEIFFQETDLIVCGAVREEEDGTVIARDGLILEKNLSPAEWMAKCFAAKDRTWIIRAWGKLYRRKAIEGLSFKEGKLYEDMFFFADLLDHVESVSITNDCLYHYVNPAGSIVNRPKTDRDFDAVRGAVCVFDRLDELGLDEYLPGAEGKIYAKMLEMKKKCGGEFKNFESFDRMKVEHMLRVMELRKRKLLRIKTVIRNVLLYLF